MNHLDFKEFFKSKILNGTEKFSVIIGSGIHFNVIKEFNCLTCWRCLLSSTSNKPLISSNNLIAFEEIIQENTKTQNNKDCNKIENELLMKISSKISNLQDTYINHDYSNVLNVFNPNYISDVISLNFDTTIETKFREKHKLKRNRRVSNVKSSIKKFSHTFVYYEYILNENKIRFWYPHGSINKPKSLILSNRSYSNYLSVIESVRKNFKSSEKQSNYQLITNNNITWVSQLINNPVLILGASLSYEEIDLWSLIISRERNFSKMKNKVCRKPIYQMTINEINNVWIEKLFDNDLNYENQWEKLSNLLK